MASFNSPLLLAFASEMDSRAESHKAKENPATTSFSENTGGDSRSDCSPFEPSCPRRSLDESHRAQDGNQHRDTLQVFSKKGVDPCRPVSDVHGEGRRTRRGHL